MRGSSDFFGWFKSNRRTSPGEIAGGQVPTTGRRPRRGNRSRVLAFAYPPRASGPPQSADAGNFPANSAFRFVALLLCALALMGGVSCSHSAPGHDQVVMIIESSPTDIDPRVGTDAQSERIDKLLFDALLRRDEHFNLQPALAERWEIPDPRTYVFHLRRGVRFHDGRPLTSVDVKWTFDSMLSGAIRTAKASTYRDIESIEAPDDATVIFHLREPYSSLPGTSRMAPSASCRAALGKTSTALPSAAAHFAW